MLSVPRVALACLVALLVLPAPARAAFPPHLDSWMPPSPTLPVPLDFAADDFECPTACVAVVPATSELLCTSHADFGPCTGGGPCALAWAAPGEAPRGWVETFTCNPLVASAVDTAAVARFSARAARLGAEPARALFHVEFRAADLPRTWRRGLLTLTATPDELALRRDGAVIDSAPWQPEPARQDPAGLVTALVYASGDGFLAAISYESVAETLPPRWVPLRVGRDHADDAIPLAADPVLRDACPGYDTCPRSYRDCAPYLERFCAGTLDRHQLAAMRAAAASAPELQLWGDRDCFVAMMNVPGASYGYAFETERWLDAFFYGSGEWLPPSCRALVRAHDSPATVPPELLRLRDAVKPIWQLSKKRKRAHRGR
ncbi:MAG: hypothetical protein H6745_33970 [Deltaproteobacteria bacterium]|nr:hypothetical protein [Deltaproteobacteria bacterium]